MGEIVLIFLLVGALLALPVCAVALSLVALARSRRVTALGARLARLEKEFREARAPAAEAEPVVPPALEALPAEARSYVEFVERELGVEVCLIGTGAAREHVLSPRGVEAVLS